MTTEQTSEWKDDFYEFGALFSFPHTAENAKAEIKQHDGFPMLYNGKYVTHDLQKYISSLLISEREKVRVTEDTSDGYHTFKELYNFRKLYNACLFNEWASQNKFSVHKSEKHSDGEKCFGVGWFIVVATLPTGDISNHYELKDWDLFKCEVKEKAKEWDGHSASDVAERLLALLKDSNQDQNN